MFHEAEKRMFERDDIIEQMKLYGEYVFYWELDEDHTKRLGLKVWEQANGRFYVTQSHHVHAPGQAGPYHSSRGSGNTPEEVLYIGIDNIRAYGKGALAAGHAYSDDWFIPNESY